MNTLQRKAFFDLKKYILINFKSCMVSCFGKIYRR